MATLACQCGSCSKPKFERTAREAFIHEVHTVGVRAKPGFWDAWAQGKLAALSGEAITTNPFHRLHAAAFDFDRGYNSVAA